MDSDNHIKLSVRTIGWIGVGAMGLPICRNLIKAGMTVIAYDVSAERMQLAAAAGAELADSVRELVSRVDTTFSMVFDDDALLAVLDAAAPSLRAGTLFVDMSTVSPEASARAAAVLAAMNVRYLRAPVSGSVNIAEAGALTVYASGTLEDLEACASVWKHMSISQHYVGRGEAARVVKLVINIMVVNATALIGEAIAFGEESGVPRDTIVDAINGSIVGSRHYASRAGSLKTRKYTTAGPVRMAAKDLDLALSIAREKGFGLPMTAFVRSCVAELVSEGRADVEVTALAEFPRPHTPSVTVDANPEALAQAAVMVADTARYRAMIDANVAGLERLLSPDLIYTHSDGRSEGKAAYLESIASKTVVYQHCDRESAAFQYFGNTALLSGNVRMEAMVGGQRKQLYSRYLTVWVLSTAGWRLHAWASTLIPPLI